MIWSVALLPLLALVVTGPKVSAEDGTGDAVGRSKRRWFQQTQVAETNCHAPLGLQYPQNKRRFILTASEGDAAAVPLHGPRAWTAAVEEAIYIDLGSEFIVTGVQTQGDPRAQQWVSSYTIAYANDCNEVEFSYIANEQGNLKNFHGNRDQNTVVTNLFHYVFEARCIELAVSKHHGTKAGLRLELLGCKKDDCTRTTLGLDNSVRYPRSRFTSNHQPRSFRHLPSSARPSGQGWTPRKSRGAWLQIQLPSEKILCGVVLLGDETGRRWVTKYGVSVSRNCMQYYYVTDDNFYAKVFDGPTNGRYKTKQMLPYPSRASCVRIHPIEYSPGGAAIRLDLIGCGTGKGVRGGCGRQKSSIISLQKRIVGGDVALQGQWPWLASMRQFGQMHACGAAIINRQWLVTAAHCVVRKTKGLDMSRPGHWTVRLGEHYVDTEEGTSFDANVEVIVPHPDYDAATQANDIALVKISTYIHFSDYINRICLPEVGELVEAGDTCYVAGWGMIDYEVGGFAQVLHHVPIKVITNSECRRKYESIGVNVTSHMMCAGAESGGQDACQGDSGGPLSCHHNGVWLISGVVSFGQGCGSDRYPGVYTRMTSYLDWIKIAIDSN
ncbi:uncharacterized protein LOC135497397 [Lineus longissimus]|uniref:uncharacterized protein LOC135497397 n=1 Tax=Lineus longissimus TaxID=88925 RepID=UPI00315C5219